MDFPSPLRSPRRLCFCDECGVLELLAKVPGVTDHRTSPAGKVSGAPAVGGRGPRAPVFNECLLDRGCGSLSSLGPSTGRSEQKRGAAAAPKATRAGGAAAGLGQVWLPAWPLGRAPGGSRSRGSAPGGRGIKRWVGLTTILHAGHRMGLGCKEQTSGLCGRRRGWDDWRGWH